MKHNFRELKIWKESMFLVKMVYQCIKSLPFDEKFGLCSQINRSVVSIPSNIAEGSGRTSEKEFTPFLNIAISSSFELETQLILISELFEVDILDCQNKVDEIQKMISGLKKIFKFKCDINSSMKIKFEDFNFSFILNDINYKPKIRQD